MSKEAKGSRKVSRTLAKALIVILVLASAVFLMYVRDNGRAPSVAHLKCPGTILYKGKLYEVPSVSAYDMPKDAALGDTLLLKFDLPRSVESRSVLRFKTYHMMVEVIDEGRIVYSYGREKLLQGRMVGSGIHYVSLDSHTQQKTVQIRFVYAIGMNQASFTDFDLVPEPYAISDYPSSHVLALLVGVFLALFGVLSVLIGFATNSYGVSGFRAVMIGLLSSSLGMWTLCYMKLFQVVSYNFALNTTLEYFSLYFAPIPFFLLLLNMRKGKIQAWKWNVTIALIITESVFLVVTTVLHALNIVLYPMSLPVFHVFVGIAFLFLFVSGVLYSRKIDLAGKVMTAGVIVFGSMTLLDLLRYHLCQHFVVEHSIFEITLLPFGALLFVLSLVMSYLIYLFSLMEAKAEKDVLSTMAYVDSLTGLFNRAKCQQIFGFLDQSTADYAIVSLDMNGLKVVNDKYGHMAGDTLIKAFSDVFKQSLAGVGTAIRMGGDEFVAIIRSEHIAEVESALAKLAQLQKACKVELPIPLEAAYGVAYRRECGADAKAETVYHEADKRMYDMKSHMKSKLVRK